MLAYTFESSAVLSCSGGSGSYFKVLGSHPDLKTRQFEGNYMLEQRPFVKKKGKIRILKSLSVQNTTIRVSVKHDNGSSSSFAVAIPPSDGKKQNKILVVAVAWSSLCFD